jgi:hypothetical protein
MEPQRTLEEKVDEALSLSRENNRLLKAMRRDALIGSVVKTVIWIALLVASFYFSMKFLEPYLGMLESMPEDGTSPDYRALIEEYQDLIGR